CARFEEAWRAKPEPDLERLLGGLPESEQKYLLLELLQTDRECRKARGQPAGPVDGPEPAAPVGYELLDEIGRGGMGVVLRGRDVDLRRDLAVKVLLEKHANRPEMAQRFLEEAQIGGQLQHPNVVPVYDVGHFGGRPF